MKFIDEYRNAELGKQLIDSIHRSSTRPIRLMEFCGGHTVSIFKHGIRQLLPSTVEMLSGPGCPVCVTANEDIDRVIALSDLPGIIIATFGDLTRVPGTRSSLQQSRAEGNDIRIVYSALEALDIARKNPQLATIMVGIGFETTAPTIAASVLQAEQEGMKNYHVLSLHKLTPPVIKAILDSGETRLDGIVCPGHVSTIIGSNPYEFIPINYGIGCVISGFEPLDILHTISMLVKQIENNRPGVEIAYRRAVRPQGNHQALRSMKQVFDISPATWRGMGSVPASGLKLKREYRNFDAEQVFDIPPTDSHEPDGCLCGDILRGVKVPPDCTLFRTACSPEHPVGPCMVSSEGTCAAYYHYGDGHG
ncbi:hydrogenase formation protein HypD [Chloroflexota bacterium]